MWEIATIKAHTVTQRSSKDWRQGLSDLLLQWVKATGGNTVVLKIASVLLHFPATILKLVVSVMQIAYRYVSYSLLILSI